MRLIAWIILRKLKFDRPSAHFFWHVLKDELDVLKNFEFG